MGTMASQITSLTIAYPAIYSAADKRKHQGSTSLASERRITGDRWIPRTYDQWRGKCFHLMTSSCSPGGVCGRGCTLTCCVVVHFQVYILKWLLVCKFSLVESNYFVFYIISCLCSCFYTVSKFAYYFTSRGIMLWNNLFMRSTL